MVHLPSFHSTGTARTPGVRRGRLVPYSVLVYCTRACVLRKVFLFYARTAGGARKVAVSSALFRWHRRMLDPEESGSAVWLARALTRLPAAVYSLAAKLRNWLYRRGVLPSRSVSVPVISVGNITAGGTGKTPLVAWLARLLVIHKLRPATLSRGYGRDDRSGLDDENRMLARMAPDVPIVVNPHRLKGAETAISEHGADVLLLDDGFQHRRIGRDLDIVVIDALQPFGGGHMLPRGLLREPLSGLRRADFLIINRANLVTEHQLERLRRHLGNLAPDAPLACCNTLARGLRDVPDGEDHPLERLRTGKWCAFCAIGNPEGFRRVLIREGCTPPSFHVFADHHAYTAQDVTALLSEAAALECQGVVTTEKDAVKVERLLAQPGLASVPVYALQTELEFTSGCPELTAAILEAAGRSL